MQPWSEGILKTFEWLWCWSEWKGRRLRSHWFLVGILWASVGDDGAHECDTLASQVHCAQPQTSNKPAKSSQQSDFFMSWNFVVSIDFKGKWKNITQTIPIDQCPWPLFLENLWLKIHVSEIYMFCGWMSAKSAISPYLSWASLWEDVKGWRA